MRLILQNIKELVQVDPQNRLWVAGKSMAEVPTIKNAFLVVQDELIENFGPMEKLGETDFESDDMIMEIDCSGKMVFPSYCDSHTHLVFAATRELEFVDRIKGLTYEEIAQRGEEIAQREADAIHRSAADRKRRNLRQPFDMRFLRSKRLIEGHGAAHRTSFAIRCGNEYVMVAVELGRQRANAGSKHAIIIA